MLSHAFQPAGDGGFTMTRTTYQDGDVTAFGQEHQDQNDTVFINLQSIEMGVQATGETFVTPLAFPVLDVFVDAAFTIANDSVCRSSVTPK